MIVLVHKNSKCIRAYHLNSKLEIAISQIDVTKGLFDLALRFQDSFIIWYHLDVESNVNFACFKKILKHNRIMASYCCQDNQFISQQIGYVESSPFANPKKNVRYPTWIMSSCVGAIHSEVISSLNLKTFTRSSFDYTLCSIAKSGQSKGLFCYSVPGLIKNNGKVSTIKNASIFEIFGFVAQHYKRRWTLILFLNCFIYENKFFIFPLLKSLFIQKKSIELNVPFVEELRKAESVRVDYDVLIPTIGRKSFLKDVLRDLAKQTFIPKNVIVIEQNPKLGSVSDLDFILEKSYPFKIKHKFIHQTGACNARNLGLKETLSDFLFFADDDIRIKPNVMEDAFYSINKYGFQAVTLSCLKKGEQERQEKSIQWLTFGSGCSVVKRALAKKALFDTSYEYGFGEDSDFGMQLRNLGCDIIYLPQPQILHLKAPIGGFRTVRSSKWDNDELKPKPSPTVMLFNLKHQSTQQINGYKTLLFFKFYKHQDIKNPFRYIKVMRQRWEKSVNLAQQL